jgi:hypothetical protein
MAVSPYQSLDRITAELKKLAEAGNWGEAAQIATQLSAQLNGAEEAGFPTARPEDRDAILSSLANIAAVTERAAPLRDDIGRLLRAFDPQAPDAAANHAKK